MNEKNKIIMPISNDCYSNKNELFFTLNLQFCWIIDTWVSKWLYLKQATCFQVVDIFISISNTQIIFKKIIIIIPYFFVSFKIQAQKKDPEDNG